ncbi:MAG: RNA polymerase sigma factor SigY [Firmicutes bacterium]|nr:RNA polymerase sigma factor SigY [Bacillota bacterium]MTI68659.1 RNA polymerase sigma factor SigY [Bacillota bacterium]
MNEEILIKLSKRGDKKALEKLLQMNYSIVKGYLIKMTLNEEVADDITQETMLKAILNIKKYKPKAKFSTWLITIATNTYKDQLRKDKRLVYKEDKDLVDDIDVEKSILIKSEFEEIKEILKEFSYEKRMPFILKHYYDYSYKEIAEIMNCPVGTVRSRLHYCIKKIKKHMEGGSDIGKKL